jgi:hypothetical protein
MLLGISNALQKEESGEQVVGTETQMPPLVDGKETFDEQTI